MSQVILHVGMYVVKSNSLLTEDVTNTVGHKKQTFFLVFPTFGKYGTFSVSLSYA